MGRNAIQITSGRKTKKPEPRIALAIHGSGSRLRLRRDIHDTLFAASFAVQSEIFHLGSGHHACQLLLAADRTHEPPLVCLNFTTVAIGIQ